MFGKNGLHLVPERLVDDWFVLAGIALSLVNGHANIEWVFEQLVEKSLVDGPTLMNPALLGRPALGVVAVSCQLLD